MTGLYQTIVRLPHRPLGFRPGHKRCGPANDGSYEWVDKPTYETTGCKGVVNG